MRNDKPNIIVDKTFQYALKVLDFAEKLYEMKRFALADQITRSGTSIGANVCMGSPECGEPGRFYS